MLVKGAYLSGAEYDAPPGWGGGEEGRNVSSQVHPFPKEATYPVPKGGVFGDHYDYVRFPETSGKGAAGGPPAMSSRGKKVEGKKVEGKVATIQSLSDGVVSEAVRAENKLFPVVKGKPPVVVREKDELPKRAPMLCIEGKKELDVGVSSLPKVGEKVLPKERNKTNASGSKVASSGGKMHAEKPKVEHVRKAWGIPKSSIAGDRGTQELPVHNHSKLDTEIKNKKIASSNVSSYKEGEKAAGGASTCAAEVSVLI